MRKLFALVFALLFVMGGSAAAVAAQATPSASPAAGGGSVDPTLGQPATFYAENGKAVMTVTATRVDRPWKGYGEYEEPDTGTEYVAIELKVENISKSSDIEVKAFDFILQDTRGYAYGTSYADGKEDARIKPLTDDVTVDAGVSKTILLVFNVNEGTELAHLFWQPENKNLITVANLAGQ